MRQDRPAVRERNRMSEGALQDSKLASRSGAPVQAITYAAIAFALSTPFWIAFKHGHAMVVAVVMLLMWCPATSAIACALNLSQAAYPDARIEVGRILQRVDRIFSSDHVWSDRVRNHLGNRHWTCTELRHHSNIGNEVPSDALKSRAGGDVHDARGRRAMGVDGRVDCRPRGRVGVAWISHARSSRKVWMENCVGPHGSDLGIWHWPVILWSTYHSAAPIWFTLVFFTLMTVSLSFLFSWLRLRSNSVWPCALLHASHNVWVQAIFTGLTVTTARSKWWIDNFGAMVPLVTAALAIAAISWVNPLKRSSLE